MYKILSCFFILITRSLLIKAGLRSLTDIIISENETQIFKLDSYFLNTNQNFTIYNNFSSILKTNLTEAFSNLLEYKNINDDDDHTERSKLRIVKNISSINSYILLFDDKFILWQWAELNENMQMIINQDCQKQNFDIPDFLFSQTQRSCSQQMKKNKYKNIKCKDFQELPNYNIYYNTAILFDCEYKDENNVSYQFFTIFGIQIFKVSKMVRNIIDNLYTQYISNNNYLNIPGLNNDIFCSTKLKFYNSILYRYCPYSSINLTNYNLSNGNYLQTWKINQFSITFISNLENVTTFLENIQIINENIIILMNYTYNLFIYNASSSNIKDTFNISNPKSICKELSNYRNGYFFLLTSNSLIQFSLIKNDFTFLFISESDINTNNISNIPISLTVTSDYVFILRNSLIQIYSYNTDTKGLNDVGIIKDFPAEFESQNKILVIFPDKIVKNSFSVFLEKKIIDTNKAIRYDWSFNITEFQKLLLSIVCCDSKNFDPSKSMQKFNFILSRKTENLTINILYWSYNDTKLYFKDITYYNNTAIAKYYEFDNENIYIPDEYLVLGQMSHLELLKVRPDNKFKINNQKYFNLSFDYLLKNKNVFLSYQNLLVNTYFFEARINSSSVTFYWQNSRDSYFLIFTCTLDSDYNIIDCLFTGKDNSINKFFFNPIIKLKTLNKFVLLNVKIDMSRIYYSDENEENYYEIFPKEISYATSCRDFYIYKPNNILFCITDNDNFFGCELEIEINLDSTKKLNCNNKILDNIVLPCSPIKVFVELIGLQNCLIIMCSDQLLFYEINRKNNEIDLIQKNKVIINIGSDVFLFLDNNYYYLVIIDIILNKIEEFSLIFPFFPSFSRKYPTFNYIIEKAFMNNKIFLYVSVHDNDKKNYFLIYNTTQFSSNLIKDRITLNTNQFVMNLNFINFDNSNSGQEYFSNLIFNSAGLIIVDQYSLNIKFFTNSDIYGNVKNIFNDKNIIKSQPYTIQMIINCINYMMNTMLMYDIMVNITFNTSIIHNYIPELIIYNPSKNNSNYFIPIQQGLFDGPIQNYKLANEDLNSNIKLNYKITPYIDINHPFDFEDYSKKEDRGNFLKSLYKDGILYVLSEKKISLHNVNNRYEIIYNYSFTQYIKCFDMYLHENLYNLYIVCNNYTLISNNNLVIDQIFLKLFEFTLGNQVKCVPNDIKGIDKFFKSFISLVLIENYLFFLVDEGYYSVIYKKEIIIFILSLPSKINDYTIYLYGKISDISFDSSYFVMSTAKDFQVFKINKINETNTLFGVLLVSKLKCEFFTVNVYVETNSILRVQEWYSMDNYSNVTIYHSINNDLFSFFTITLLNLTYNFSESRTYNDYKIIYLVSSNLNLYEFTSIISNNTIITHSNYEYKKFYACVFTQRTRPRKFKNLVGSFCSQYPIGDGRLENGFNYFILHIVENNETETQKIEPVLGIPIYLENYNFQIISKNNCEINDPFHPDEDDFIILPSFSNLFSEYKIFNNISLQIQEENLNSQENSLKLIALNDISQSYVNLRVIFTNDTKNDYLLIILLSTLIPSFIVFILFIIYLIRKRKKNREIQEKEYRKALLDDNNNNYLDETKGYLTINYNKNDSIDSSSRDSCTFKKTQSFINNEVKKIEKWK